MHSLRVPPRPSEIFLLFFLALIYSGVSSSLLLADEKGVMPIALDGYDPISYFTNDKAIAGKLDYQKEYKGERYTFVSEDNMSLFSAHPERFLPQYGGACAHSATAQSPVAGDPSIYTVDQGKLYFFSNEVAKSQWPTDISSNQVGLMPLALQGFDVTTYFDESGIAAKGNERYQAVFNGKRYLFVSQVNQQQFAAEPERFLPQYGGYCSHSVSQGAPIPSDPSLFIVEDEKLYLFSADEAKEAWLSQPLVTRNLASKNWHFEANRRNSQIAAKNRWKKETEVKLFSF